jgi:UDP-N-acetylglucosamine--N-acetylmuramyl-(pentapeptide) pyrophosphoryl-undecaprenol N-acetylglucosamine transferase
MFPAVALGGVLLERGHRVVFATDARGVDYVKRLDGAEAVVVPAASPSRGGLIGKVTFAFTLARGAWAAARLLRRLGARGIVGFGGYASFPTCFMACRQGRPVVLHEQNAWLGLANRKLATRVAAIATSFRNVRAIPAGVRVEETGNPVRPAFIDLHPRSYTAPAADGVVRLLVLGGSQGARIFSDVIPEAVALLDESERRRLNLTQQCRPEDLDRVRARYGELGVDADLGDFFDDVPARAGGAHLMICRSGAGTVSEALVAGLPTIMVPYPFAADNHQFHNAEEVAEAGAGWLMAQDDFSAEALARRLKELLADPAALADASQAATGRAIPDAASRLADLVEDIMGAAE